MVYVFLLGTEILIHFWRSGREEFRERSRDSGVNFPFEPLFDCIMFKSLKNLKTNRYTTSSILGLRPERVQEGDGQIRFQVPRVRPARLSGVPAVRPRGPPFRAEPRQEGQEEGEGTSGGRDQQQQPRGLYYQSEEDFLASGNFPSNLLIL